MITKNLEYKKKKVVKLSTICDKKKKCYAFTRYFK